MQYWQFLHVVPIGTQNRGRNLFYKHIAPDGALH